MTDYNPVLENLQERVVQEKPIKLIHAQSAYSAFNRGNIEEFNGAYSEWIGDQPLEGVKWKKRMKDDETDEMPEVFSCRLPIILDKVYYTIVNKRAMKRALQSPVETAILLDRLTDSMKTKPVSDVNKKITEIICTKENYKDSAWEEITPEEATIDNLDKAVAILKKIKAASNAMLEISDQYNKGYQKPGDTTWNEVETNCESQKSQVLTIDPDWLDDLEIHFLADVARDSELNPRKIFKEVIKKKLAKGVLATIHDEKSVAYQAINDDGLKIKDEFGSGSTKIGIHVTVVGGMIPFTNSWALVKGN